jgi:hypothetical protein
VGTVIGVAGIVLALVFAKWRSMRFSVYGTTVVEEYKSRLKGLSVVYKGKEAETLSVTRLAFWNSGNDTISHNDISKINPLCVGKDEGVEILDVFPVFSSSESCGINVIYKNPGDIFTIDFEYLDFGKGGVVQVIHTGNKPGKVWLQGEIKGIRKLRRYQSFRTSSNTYLIAIMLPMVAMVISVIAAAGIKAKLGWSDNLDFVIWGLDPLVGTMGVLGMIYGIDRLFFPKPIHEELFSLPFGGLRSNQKDEVQRNRPGQVIDSR